MSSQNYVLLVEDEDSIRLALKEYLDSVGIQSLVASDGVGAIKHLLDYEVKVIVTDYRMDVLGGDYWIRFLQRFCPHLRVLLTSGFLSNVGKLPYEVLPKPLIFSELEARVRSLLES
ncbi:MAG: response regulator [Spirochaetales bacterium]|nr:response regulator [Spirochaetales bacterium]